MLSHLFYKYLTYKFALPDAIALAIELQSAGLTAHGNMLLAYACRPEGNHVLLDTNPWTNGSCYIAPLPPVGRLKNEDIWFDTVEISAHVRFQDFWLPLFPVYSWQYMGFIQTSHYAMASKNFFQYNKNNDSYSNLPDDYNGTDFVFGLSAVEIAIYCHWFQKSPFVPTGLSTPQYTPQLASAKVVLAGIPPHWESHRHYLQIDLSGENIDYQWQLIPLHTALSTHNSIQTQYLPINHTAFATTPDTDLLHGYTNRLLFPLGLEVHSTAPRPLPLIRTSLQENQYRLSNAFKEYLSSNFAEPAVNNLVRALNICELQTYASCLQIFFTNIGSVSKIHETASRLFSAGTTFIGFYPPEKEAQDNDVWFDLTELSPFLLHEGAWFPLKPVYWWQFACFVSCTADTQDPLSPETTGHTNDAARSSRILPDLACNTPVDRITLPEAIAYAKWFGKKVFDPLTGPDKDSPFSALLRPGWRLWSPVEINKQTAGVAMAFDQINRKLSYDEVFDVYADTINPPVQCLFDPLQFHEKITFATTVNQTDINHSAGKSLIQFAPRPAHPNVINEQNISLRLSLAHSNYLKDRSDRSCVEHLCAMLENAGLREYSELIWQYQQAGSPHLPMKAKSNPWTTASCYLGSYPPKVAESETIWFDVVELTPSVFSGKLWIPLRPVYTWQFIAFLHCCEYATYYEWDCEYRTNSMDNKTKLLKSLSLISDPLSPVVNLQTAEACAYARWFHKQLFDPFLFSDSTAEKYMPNPALKYLTDIFPSSTAYGTLIFDDFNNQLLSEEDITNADLQPSQLSIFQCYEPHDAVFATCPDIFTGELISLNLELEKAKSIALLNQAARNFPETLISADK